MDEEEFLLLDEDEESESTTSSIKSNSEKSINSDARGIISNISRTMGDSLSQIPMKIKQSSDMKKILQERKDNMKSFASSADSILDADLVVDGIYDIEWGIDGMDCADCAMKATKAVNRLPGVDDVKVSVTEGTVKFSLDLAKGKVSRANSVLESLGHNPLVIWQSVFGITPGGAASNLGIDRKSLRTALLDVPGVIKVTFEDGKIE